MGRKKKSHGNIYEEFFVAFKYDGMVKGL